MREIKNTLKRVVLGRVGVTRPASTGLTVTAQIVQWSKGALLFDKSIDLQGEARSLRPSDEMNCAMEAFNEGLWGFYQEEAEKKPLIHTGSIDRP